MKRWLICTGLLVLAACGSSDSNGNTAGAAATGVPVGGMAGTAGTPLAGAAGVAGAAGAAGAAGVAGAAGAAGVAGVAGAAGVAGGAGVGGMAGAAGAAGVAGGAGEPLAGTGGSGGEPAAGSAGDPVAGSGGDTPGTVTVEFTTVSYGGEYAPLNYGAVWFEDSAGTFIKTAKRWAGAAHATDLVTWTAASGGWGSLFFPGGNTADMMMDVISSATIRSHETHSVTWNMMDTTPALVPDGEYVAVLEMSESRARDRDGPVVRIPFTKGPSAQTATAPDQEGFSGVTLNYTP